jgi:hypothetical protein
MIKKQNQLFASVPRRRRRGSVMLIGMLAAVAISTSVITLGYAHRRSLRRIESRRTVMLSGSETMGLHQRALAMLKNDPSFQGIMAPTTPSTSGAYVRVRSIGPGQASIEVFAYATAATPRILRVVDPNKL